MKIQEPARLHQSDRNDYRRNEQVTKALKSKYGLTYGTDKSNTNTRKLRKAERAKYEIPNAVKDALKGADSWQKFKNELAKRGVHLEFVYLDKLFALPSQLVLQHVREQIPAIVRYGFAKAAFSANLRTLEAISVLAESDALHLGSLPGKLGGSDRCRYAFTKHLAGYYRYTYQPGTDSGR